MTHHTRRGRPSASGAVPPCAAESAFRRAASDDYFTWLDHIWPAAGCASPVRLHGTIQHIDLATGELLRDVTTKNLPDGVIYKACGNRRTSVCSSCAETYRQDAYQVVRSGLTGGHGVPDQVAAHPAVFATFTAPSFGLVHNRVVRNCTCPDPARCTCQAAPCHPRRDKPTCDHGHALTCYIRHHPGDPQIGQPLCLDCYDHDGHVVWNNSAGELWRRTKQAIERYLNTLARQRHLPPLRVSHGKAAEYQARGAVHFHVLLRVDGLDDHDPDTLTPPPAGITAADLENAIRQAAAAIRYRTPPHPGQPGGWLITWGTELDVRAIAMHGTNPVTDNMVAGYLAKYATKGTEITGHSSRRLDASTISVYADPAGTHVQRLIHAARTLGRWHAGNPWPAGRTCSGSAAISSPRVVATPSPSRRCETPGSPTSVPRPPGQDTDRSIVKKTLTTKPSSSSTGCPMTGPAGTPRETRSWPTPPPIRPDVDARPPVTKRPPRISRQQPDT